MIYPYRGTYPVIHPSVFIAADAAVTGSVDLAEDVSVWHGAVIRGDIHWIRVGARTNVQDNCVLHVTADEAPLSIGSGVTIGHGAVLHGCTIGDGCLIGMNATVLDRAVVRADCLIAAGAVVLEESDVPAGSLVAGVPGKVVRALTAEEREGIRQSAGHYIRYVAEYRAHHAMERGLDLEEYFLRQKGGER